MNQIIYQIKTKYLFFLRPKIVIKNENDIYIKLFFLKRKISIIKEKPKQIIFNLKIAIINTEIIINLGNQNQFNGFFDTIVGNIYFSGKKILR